MPAEHETFALAPEPDAARAQLEQLSAERCVLVFKRSPICPISTRAEAELDAWLETRDDARALSVARVNVIAERALARGLTAALDVQHESPQALWFQGGRLRWHGSHGALTRERFRELATG